MLRLILNFLLIVTVLAVSNCAFNDLLEDMFDEQEKEMLADLSIEEIIQKDKLSLTFYDPGGKLQTRLYHDRSLNSVYKGEGDHIQTNIARYSYNPQVFEAPKSYEIFLGDTDEKLMEMSLVTIQKHKELGRAEAIYAPGFLMLTPSLYQSFLNKSLKPGYVDGISSMDGIPKIIGPEGIYQVKSVLFFKNKKTGRKFKRSFYQKAQKKNICDFKTDSAESKIDREKKCFS